MMKRWCGTRCDPSNSTLNHSLVFPQKGGRIWVSHQGTRCPPANPSFFPAENLRRLLFCASTTFFLRPINWMVDNVFCRCFILFSLGANGIAALAWARPSLQPPPIWCQTWKKSKANPSTHATAILPEIPSKPFWQVWRGRTMRCAFLQVQYRPKSIVRLRIFSRKHCTTWLIYSKQKIVRNRNESQLRNKVSYDWVMIIRRGQKVSYTWKSAYFQGYKVLDAQGMTYNRVQKVSYT